MADISSRSQIDFVSVLEALQEPPTLKTRKFYHLDRV